LVIGLVGIRAADVVALHTGLHDPQVVVIDEVAGTLLTLTAAPATTKGVVTAFLLFRMLDQCKPWPAGWAERRLRGGLGIMLDDVVAGLWGALLLVLLRRFSWIEVLLS
jgi:phosphatidylglycerophosphatase A